MKKDKYVRPATLDDVLWLSSRLRQEDTDEIHASTGNSPLNSMLYGIVHSDPCNTLIGEAGEVVGIYGAVPLPGSPDVGVVWMHCTPDLEKYPFQFLRRCRARVLELHQKYRMLMNYVDARNTVHIRWLRWCGFKFLNIQPHGFEQRPFYEFVRVAYV
jgi:hypothetical protein